MINYWNQLLIIFKTIQRKQKKIQIRFTQFEFYDLLLRFTIDVNLSFQAVESFALKKLLQYLRFELKLSNRTFFDNMIKMKAMKMKKNIFKNLKFKTKMSIVLNVWISMNHIAFLKIICYFMNRHFDYREMFLFFTFLQNKHIEDRFAEIVLKVLLKYDLIKRLLCVTTNNASNNLFTRNHLEKKLRALNIYWSVANETMNCMTHVFQLSITTFFFKLKILVINDEIAVRFDEKNLDEMKKNVFFENILRKIN
jgi:hypothetical protein